MQLLASTVEMRTLPAFSVIRVHALFVLSGGDMYATIVFIGM